MDGWVVNYAHLSDSSFLPSFFKMSYSYTTLFYGNMYLVSLAIWSYNIQ